MNSKKIIIEILAFILITVLAVTGYQVFAAATTEMISESDILNGNRNIRGMTITFNNLVTEASILCSGHDIALPGEASTNVQSGNGSSKSIPLPKEGSVAFSTGITTSSRNPYSSTTSKTLSKYYGEGVTTALPEESYILAEMSENTNGNTGTLYNVTNRKYNGEISDKYTIPLESDVLYGVDVKNGEPTAYVLKDEDDYYYVDVQTIGSDYFPYTYVQQAWWSTPAGSKGTAVKQNGFSAEAKEFQKYIDSIRSGSDTEDRTVSVDGQTVTVPAPKLSYNVTTTSSTAQVRYDEESRKYLVGPFVINYPEWTVTSSDRGNIMFSGISNMSLKAIRVNGNTNQEFVVDDSKWEIVHTGVRSESDIENNVVYPHDGEQFYISVDYMDNVVAISDINVDFKYMNAGATYENVDGTFNIVSWTPKTVKHSDGFFPTYIHTLECTGIDSKKSQPLTIGLEAARWYESTSCSLFAQNVDNPTPTPTPTYTPTPTPPTDNPPSTYTPPTPHTPGRPKKKIELTVPMSGKVWIDTEPDKANGNVTDGKYDDGEKGYKNAEVYVYKTYMKNGKVTKRELAKIYDEDEDKELSFPIYTDENGDYSIPKILVPGDESDKNSEISYDVVFKYDGQTYEGSSFLPTGNGDANNYINATRTEKNEKYANDSLASENANERNEFNEKFKTVLGKSSMDDNGNTEGTTSKDVSLNYSSESVSQDGNSKRVSNLKTLDDNGYVLEQFKMEASTGEKGILFPVNHKITKDNADEVISTVTKENRVTTTKYHSIYNYMLHINYSVKERQESDLGVLKDLYTAKIVVNEKEITKKYNTLVDMEDEKYSDFLNVQLQNAKTSSYKVGLFKSDYDYRATVYDKEADAVKAIKQGNNGNLTDLKVYLTYKIVVLNEGNYDMIVNSLNDYYDKTFTLVTEEQKANISGTDGRTEKVVAEPSYYRVIKAGETPNYTYLRDGMAEFKWNSSEVSANDSYKSGSITAFNELKLKPGEQLQLFVTYEVDKDGTLNGTRETNMLGEKNNVAEIASYSSYNSDGSVAGKIDDDSAPDNIRLDKVTDKSWYEDDTESAPAVKIEISNYISRTINGTVWEDKESDTIKFDQKVGNGKLDDGENKVKDIDVQLVEKIDVDGQRYEHIWTNEDVKNYFPTANLSDYSFSNISTNENGDYTFKGVLAGNYVVRFTYGNKNSDYNGQDYKNTAYEAGLTDLNQEWQDLRSSEEVNKQRVSDARDDEARRMDVVAYSRDSIENNLAQVLADHSSDEFMDKTYMVANTAKLNLDIESIDNIKDDVVEGTEEYVYNVNNIDFGLEKRSETKLETSKQISKITLFANDGTEPVLDVVFNNDGSINKDASKKYDVLSIIPETNSAQGIMFANIEKSLLNNLSIKIEYRISVANKSEVDWTGDMPSSSSEISAKANELKNARLSTSYNNDYGKYVGLNYYNNKNNDSDKIVTTRVNRVIDYVDNNIGVDATENLQTVDHSWKSISTNELVSGKVLADSVYNDEGKIVDEKGREFEKDGSNNIVVSEDEYNKALVRELVPEVAKDLGDTYGEIFITTSKDINSPSDADDLKFNNLAEIISYTNTVGRRDTSSVPGNAKIGSGTYDASKSESDAGASYELTFFEPTGLSKEEETKNSVAIIVLISGIVIAAGIIVTKKFLKK